jgi:UMF1 family MFS transporter
MEPKENPYQSPQVPPEGRSRVVSAAGPATQREIYAWAMYDWANSAYTSLSITVLMLYITKVVVGEKSALAAQLSEMARGFGNNVDEKNWGPTAFAWGISASMLVAALLSPIVGAMADAKASKRRWLATTALAGAAGSVLMALLPSDWGWLVLLLFFTVSLCFELSFGFYNGFLPELATDKTMDRVSALGFSFGYVGGGIALALQFLVFTYGESWGISDPVVQLKIGLAIMGLWWGLFSLPTFLILRDRTPPRAADRAAWQTARFAVGEVTATLRNIHLSAGLFVL